jgi:hypothetical protein
MSNYLMRAYVNALLAKPQAERQAIADESRRKRMEEAARLQAEQDAKQAKLREMYGDWVDDPDFFEF